MPNVPPAPVTDPSRRPASLTPPRPPAYLSPEDRRWLADLEEQAVLRGLPPLPRG